MSNIIKILGIHGSLRKDSYNKIVLETARDLLPKNVEMEIFELDKIPIFNQDLENTPSEVVTTFKKKIRDADAILIATPEYNYSVPGVLKNAIDWASRPYPDNSWDGKPVAIMSASEGLLGGARAQYHLRQIFVYLNMYPINKPEVIIQNAKEKIYKGKLEDAHSIEKIKELLNALVDWTMKLQH
ncbi:NAD(P)H-dependent oxidoreductase [Candidatus Marsarchaeota archaeon]|nr:NAD(P)H-dependent oxidoreductase [Candidatus Marsarchaeota archaeon]